MARYKHTILNALYTLIEVHPGRSAYWHAKLLGWSQPNYQSRLRTMETAGYLVAQDPKGGLHPFRKIPARCPESCCLRPPSKRCEVMCCINRDARHSRKHSQCCAQCPKGCC